MSNTKLETIQFHSQQLIVLNYQNKPYVAMKPVCENIGLDWAAQLKRIKRHQVLRAGMVIMTTPSKQGLQEYVCLPISMINGWLFGIETSRVKPEIRATLEQYQLECFDVLYSHFMPKVAQQHPNTISLEQQQAIQQAVNERVYRTGERHQAIYSRLHQQFKIPRYQDLPASKFDEAIKWLGGLHSRKGLSDEDWYDLAWLYKAAERMRYQIELIEPALRVIDSGFRGNFYSMAREYKRVLYSAKVIIERETAHIQPKGIADNWHRVLPVIKNS
ncbi:MULTISPECIES: phage antirepressor N-terminal domain-containing protein [unclassified Gilliamella]|uniref:phage antirepressor N-terminal domain-containing protein n=1 Tax=unclassified Gilliamella TaxID=2685620 RepID=UPI002269A268|nr:MULTISPECIES: phage antirepressor N-terminal domain-containing protein [unclassified Gilliamella]MCX8583447.1 ORF6C domain-containing protein [Gilliamella sp. B3372]MCX8594059.1 ORF6C domain-containing protein [Gilliamella sp. B3367]